MTRGRILRSAQALADIEAAAYYREVGGTLLSREFLDALRAAFELMADAPQLGSQRHSEWLGIEGLRSWSVRGYPYSVWTVEVGDTIEVWRVLHTARDLPPALRRD